MLDRLFPRSAQRARTALMRPLGESSPFCRALSVRRGAFLTQEKKKNGGFGRRDCNWCVSGTLGRLRTSPEHDGMTRKLGKWHLIVIRNAYRH